MFKGRRFGQRRPPLTELIQNILERYPDGGQILKVKKEGRNNFSTAVEKRTQLIQNHKIRKYR